MSSTALPATCLRDWTDAIRRMRLGTATKSVALAMASYANPDGSRVFPGIARLAYVCELHYETVKKALRKLRALGLIRKVGRKGDADEYRLVCVEDLPRQLPVPSPSDAGIEISKIAKRYQRKVPVPEASVPPVPEASVFIEGDNVLPVSQASVESVAAEPCTGALETPSDSCTGALETPVQVPEAPATNHYLSPKSTLQYAEDQIAHVLVPGEKQDQNEVPQISPSRCEPHNLPAGRCPFCARGLPGADPRPQPRARKKPS